MDAKKTKRISKFMSLVLRHQPQKIGIQLDSAGWVEIDQFLKAMSKSGTSINREQLEYVVSSNDKQRFTIDESGLKIRAKQGHSVAVELGYESSEPPELLCHGTPSQFVPLIRESGLKKMNRHHVHMHPDQSIANEVGNRRGKSVLLIVRSREMHELGHKFYVTENEVWLTDHVPSKFINFPTE